MAGAGGTCKPPVGVHGRNLDIIKSLYAHDSAAVRSSQGISAIFRCLMGVKQGCPLSPIMFALYVDGLEKHLLETADIDAPKLMGVMVPLLLYADDLILMSESASGLQKQLDALASFCEQRQLTISARQKWWSLKPGKVTCVTLCSVVQLWKGWRATSIWGLSSMPLRN